jgi:hypothetical protein
VPGGAGLGVSLDMDAVEKYSGRRLAQERGSA